MSEILTWIENGQNYDEGVALYQQFGTSDFYKKLFSSGLTPYNKTKLLVEMQKICPAVVEVPEKAEPTEKPKPEVTPPAKTNTKDYERYLRIKKHIEYLYLQANRAKFTLNTNKNRHILLQTALLLKKLKRGVMDHYKLIDYFDDFGSFPSAEPVNDVGNIKDPAKKIQLLRQSNAKAKARLADKDCKTRVKTEKLIIKNNQIIDALLVKIGRK